ncbi:MAG: antibiotic biosynthesis monooxygenase [Gammaproteobacteria bacterium]|nr:antibiotic biosynthesis monooxygenase [Gammaproteobacteria bacterium]
MSLATTPKPPYYAVIFTSVRSNTDEGYAITADRMVQLAEQQPGFLGAESARGDDKLGITVSYWEDESSIRTWRENSEHQVAQEMGKKQWYLAYRIRIARVERDYGL